MRNNLILELEEKVKTVSRIDTFILIIDTLRKFFSNWRAWGELSEARKETFD